MATGIVIAGHGTLRLDNVEVHASSMKAKIGSVKRSKVTAMDGVWGDREEIQAPTLTATIIMTNDISLDWLSNLSGIEIEGACKSGRTFVLEGASITEPPEYSVEDGTCDISFEALSGTETGV